MKIVKGKDCSTMHHQVMYPLDGEGQYPEMYEKLAVYIHNICELGFPVETWMVILGAKGIFRAMNPDLYPSETDIRTNGNEDLTSSIKFHYTWLKNFSITTQKLSTKMNTKN